MRKLLLLAAASVALTGCTAAVQERVESTVATICTSAPIAQALYNTAVASGDDNRINQILSYIQATCPTVLILIQTVPVPGGAIPIPPPPPIPTPTPERG